MHESPSHRLGRYALAVTGGVILVAGLGSISILATGRGVASATLEPIVDANFLPDSSEPQDPTILPDAAAPPDLQMGPMITPIAPSPGSTKP